MQNTREYEIAGRSYNQEEETVKTYFMGRVILTQLVVFTILALIVFFISRSGSGLADRLKELYKNLFCKD